MDASTLKKLTVATHVHSKLGSKHFVPPSPRASRLAKLRFSRVFAFHRAVFVLIFSSLLLKAPVTEQLTARAVVQGRMQALADLENLNVLEGYCPHSIARLEIRRIY